MDELLVTPAPVRHASEGGHIHFLADAGEQIRRDGYAYYGFSGHEHGEFRVLLPRGEDFFHKRASRAIELQARRDAPARFGAAQVFRPRLHVRHGKSPMRPAAWPTGRGQRREAPTAASNMTSTISSDTPVVT